MIFLLSDRLIFPDPAMADEDGLLAVGGDLSTERLVLAYQNGIFPWYSEGEPICWYSPHRRFVLEPHEVYVSHSMKQIMRSHKYRVTYDTVFREVIKQCAQTKRKGQGGTWITDAMTEAYTALHDLGIAHSAEVWNGDKLAGGLYGVEINRIFCGESMFSLEPNTSKLALIWLCHNKPLRLIDCQLHSEHLERMGGRYMERRDYMAALRS